MGSGQKTPEEVSHGSKFGELTCHVLCALKLVEVSLQLDLSLMYTKITAAAQASNDYLRHDKSKDCTDGNTAVVALNFDCGYRNWRAIHFGVHKFLTLVRDGNGWREIERERV